MYCGFCTTEGVLFYSFFCFSLIFDYLFSYFIFLSSYQVGAVLCNPQLIIKTIINKYIYIYNFQGCFYKLHHHRFFSFHIKGSCQTRVFSISWIQVHGCHFLLVSTAPLCSWLLLMSILSLILLFGSGGGLPLAILFLRIFSVAFFLIYFVTLYAQPSFMLPSLLAWASVFIVYSLFIVYSYLLLTAR